MVQRRIDALDTGLQDPRSAEMAVVRWPVTVFIGAASGLDADEIVT